MQVSRGIYICILALGSYRTFEVKKETNLIDLYMICHQQHCVVTENPNNKITLHGRENSNHIYITS